MARKRGGLAGIWDRNKQIIKPVATTLAGIIGTPALGAAVGAAMGGLDRPGQSGVGLDVGGALKGGVSGYGMGKIGAALPGIAKMGQAGAASGGLWGGLKAGAKAAIPSFLGAGGGGDVPGLPGLGPIGDFLGGNKGLNALAAAQGLNAANLGRQSTEYAKNAMQTQDDLWKQRAGLRSGGIEGLNRTPVQLPQLATLSRAGNPFSRAR